MSDTGLWWGLGNTGDTKDNFTKDSLINMMERMGVAVDSRNLKAGNVASVMVTASLPVSAKAGSNVDVTVSSIGSATSLQGGVLLQTPLKGMDGKIYALAQGAIIVGGYSATGAAARTQKNSTTVASIPGGAIVEREVPFSFNSQEELTLNMQIADFSTTQQVVEPAEQEHGRPVCQRAGYQHSADQGSFRLSGQSCAAAGHGGESGGHARTRAKVVVDEKTGTIVIGRDVRIARVAVAHGNLQVTVQESAQVSQPGPFSNGTTVVTPTTDLQTREENRHLNLVEGATLQELVDGLNAIGAAPRDLISILKNLKASGSLYADLEVI